MFGECCVFWVDFDAEVVAFELLGRYDGCSCAAEWVEDEVSFVGVVFDEVAQEFERFLRRALLPVLEGRLLSDVASESWPPGASGK